MNILTNFYSFLVLPIDVADTEKGKILWLTRLRWIFLFIQFFLVIPFLILNIAEFRQLYFYTGLCVLLCLFNIFMMIKLRNDEKNYSSLFTFSCLAIDLIWFTFLFWFLIKVGQFHAENIYFIHAILGAILLPGRKSVIFYALIAACLFFIQMFQYNYFPQNQFVFNQIILFAVWRITSTVSKYVFSQREQLSQMKIYAEKMDRLRAVGALTAGFSHEFASPLNTIKLRINRMARKNSASTEDIESALSAVESCEKIIRHMNSSQMDKRDIIFQSVNLNTAIHEIINSWIQDHVDANVTINYNTKIPTLLKIPLINLSQGLLNILDNAYESDPKNAIVVSLEVSDNRLKILVSDTGAGFPPDVIERFGEPFVTTKKNGTGLGLYSFHLFAESIGGNVTIENLIPRGALVKFTSPVVNS